MDKFGFFRDNVDALTMNIVLKCFIIRILLVCPLTEVLSLFCTVYELFHSEVFIVRVDTLATGTGYYTLHISSY